MDLYPIIGDFPTAMFEALHLFSETEEGSLLKIFEMIKYSSKRAKTPTSQKATYSTWNSLVKFG